MHNAPIHFKSTHDLTIHNVFFVCITIYCIMYMCVHFGYLHVVQNEYMYTHFASEHNMLYAVEYAHARCISRRFGEKQHMFVPCTHLQTLTSTGNIVDTT